MEEKHHEVLIEKLILSTLKDDSIIKFHSSFHDNLKLYFLMEYAPNGSLYDLLKKEKVLSFKLAQHFAAEIVLGLECLHKYQVIHRDLKPGNLLLDQNFHIKFIDFATSKILNPSLIKKVPQKKSLSSSNILQHKNQDKDEQSPEKERNDSLVGTEEYVSPEILQKQPVSYSTDLWSFGVILYQFFYEKTPFKGSSEYVTFENILKSELTFPSSSKIPDEAKNLI